MFDIFLCIWYNVFMGKDMFTINKNDLSYGRGYVYSLQYHLVWCTTVSYTHLSISEWDSASELTNPVSEDGYLCGATGCGLCTLKQLSDAGITQDVYKRQSYLQWKKSY